MGDADLDQSHKKFRPQKKGRGAEKKTVAKKKRKGIELEPNRGSNPKAFTRPSDGTYKSKMFRQKTEIVEQALRVPTLDLGYAEAGKAAPLLVAVVGPPKSGKSTLIRSLVKMYTNKALKNTCGPITVVGGKTKRFTLFECPSTLHAMCDISKVADVVLLTVDASFGFEMETFEFLNMALVHGMPRIIGVLTHLDKLKNNKALKKTKKALRHRFWQEIAQGSKLFYLTGMDKTLYKRKEIVNLNHFLLVTKPMEQRWKAAHAHLLADRWEDITPEVDVAADPKCSRDVAFFGYVRGRPLKENQSIHIPGVGDYPISHIMWVQDPCAAPGKSEYKKRRQLNAKEKLVYGPLADIGEMRYDKDAVYVRMDEEAVAHTRVGRGHDMIAELQSGVGVTPDVPLNLIEGTTATYNRRSAMHLLEREMDEKSNAENWSDGKEGEEWTDESDDETESKRTAHRHRNHAEESDEDAYEDEEAFDHRSRTAGVPFTGVSVETWDWYRSLDRARGDYSSYMDHPSPIPWSKDAKVLSVIRNFFVTGEWAAWEGGMAVAADDVPPQALDKGYESVTDSSEDEDRSKDEANATAAASRTKKGKASKGTSKSSATGPIADPEAAELLNSFLSNPSAASPHLPNSASSNIGNPSNSEPSIPEGVDPEYWKKKVERKKLFDQGVQDVDAQVDPGDGAKGGSKLTYYEQLKDTVRETQENIEQNVRQLARTTDEKISLVGYYTGLYVRIVLRNVPVEFTQYFQPTHPLILGGLLPGEDSVHIVYARVKRHRWHHKILKANDPLVLSVGWRRFQTQPIYATEDVTGKQRYLKYTPKHMHCIAAYCGPSMPPNTGVVAIPWDPTQARDHFRVLATGYTMEVAKHSEIVKKLKLVGTPEKIIKNTVFVKGMFNSAAEAAKFEGAKLQTVSGLRGAIKKAIPNRDGVFRASFEDKMLMSDIIFLRTFKRVEPQSYYNPVTNYLASGKWKGMRSTRELRRDLNKPLPYNPDSEYLENPIHNKARDRPISMPGNLMRTVPFADKVHFEPSRREIGIPKRLREEVDELTDVITDAHAVRKDRLMEHFRMVEHDIDEKKAVKDEKRQKVLLKKEAEDAERKARLLKKFKKEQSKKLAMKTPMRRGKTVSR